MSAFFGPPKSKVQQEAEMIRERYRKGEQFKEMLKDLPFTWSTLFRRLKLIGGLKVEDKIEHLKNRKEEI